MKNTLRKLYAKYQILANDEGQDLVEYALVGALIGFAATASMTTLATNINTAFTAIGTRLTTYRELVVQRAGRGNPRRPLILQNDKPYISWPVFAMVSTASVVDIRTRRIPAWLTLPSLLAGG